MDYSKRATPMPREVRRWAMSNVELRDGTTETALVLDGHASVTEHPYTVRDMFGEFTETIRTGAFDKTLAEHPDVMLLVNHDGLPLARTTSGTLRLDVDTVGLHVDADLDKTDPDVQRLEPKMRRGDLDEMSFAFRVIRQEWNEDYTDRAILEVSLHKGDVSVVNYGANPATSAALRGLGITVDEFADALTALSDGTATDDQITVAERAHLHLEGLLRSDDTQVPLSVLEAQRDLWLRKYPAA